MKCSRLRNQLCLSLAMLPPLTWAASNSAVQAADVATQVKVRIYNYAQAESKSLRKVEKEAARIFRLAQIEIEWLDCLELMQRRQESSPCREPLGPYELTLRILAERGSSGAVFRDSHLGFALPAPEGGTHASIFFPDVVSMSQLKSIDLAPLFGHAVAHEIGHLLLNRSDHSTTGLMRGHWDSKDLVQICRGELLFSPKEAELMGAELERRISTRLSCTSISLSWLSFTQ